MISQSVIQRQYAANLRTQHLGHLCGRFLLESSVADHPRAMDDSVQLAVLLDDVANHLLEPLRIGNVAREVGDALSQFRQLCDAQRLGGSSPRQDHFGASRGEGVSQHPANPAETSGDPDHIARFDSDSLTGQLRSFAQS